MSALKIAMVVPDGTPVEGGNWSSAKRIADGLQRFGHQVWMGHLSEWRDDGFDVVHALNARTTALPLLRAGLAPERLVVTWTGTDVWRPETYEPENRAALTAVHRHTVLTPDAVAVVAGRLGLSFEQVRYVPPSVDPEKFSPSGPRQPLAHPVLLIPGAGRPEKGALEALELVDALQAFKPVHLAIVGPSRDDVYWARVMTRLEAAPWASWYGPVPPAEMPRWYRAADVVINTSLTEGLSNALLEALAVGRPVLARDIPGNRSLLEPGAVGRLFDQPDEFVREAAELLENPGEAEALGRRARAYVLEHFHAADELARFQALYQELEPSSCRAR